MIEDPRASGVWNWYFISEMATQYKNVSAVNLSYYQNNDRPPRANTIVIHEIYNSSSGSVIVCSPAA